MSHDRVAVVGCGSRSRAHIGAYRHIAEAQVVACCDPQAERREKLAAEFDLGPYPDARAMIEHEKPDLVHLVTQPDLRVELMTLVSDLGVPLCTLEKPISTGVSDWQSLCALEALTRTHFAVCRVQEAWEIQLSGNCGKVLLKPGI